VHLVPGDRVDRYVLLEPLGEGGQGAVWKAEDQLVPGSLRALKLVALAPSRPDDVERVRREARALARLDHPSLVVCHALFEDLRRSLLGIVMDFVDGSSLRRVEEDAKLTQRHRVAALRSLARVLGYVHRAGVVHRDLKLDNVLVTKQFWEEPEDPSHLKLVDFGIAKVPGAGEALTQLDTVIGTPSYLAPEQIEPSRFGTAHAPAADIFAFGVVAYRLLMGAHPTSLERGATLMDYAAAYRRVEERGKPWPEAVPDGGWGQLIRDCLALRVSTRIPNATELERRIENVGDASAVVRPLAVMPPSSSPTVVETPGAMTGATVDMPAVGAFDPTVVAGSTPSPSLGPRVSRDAPTRPLGPVAQPAPQPMRTAGRGAGMLAGAVAVLAVVVGSALVWQRARTRDEVPPPLPSGDASNQLRQPPLDLVPEDAADGASDCEKCASGHDCGGACEQTLAPGESFSVRPGGIWVKGAMLVRPGLEMCLKRAASADAVCTPLAALADAGVPAQALQIETFDLLKDGIAIEVFDKTENSPVPIARGLLRRQVWRKELCSGVAVHLDEPGDIERLVLFIDPADKPPAHRCLSLLEERPENAPPALDARP
jgi:serine/threonine-protein kinase